jgi:hypothetical protein
MAIIFATQDSNGDPITFTLVRGTEWDDDVVLTDQTSGDPIDLTAVTELWMRVRTSATSSILLELSTDNGRLVITDAAGGQIGIRVSSEDTRDFPENRHKKAKYLYDLVLERTTGEYEAGISGKIVVLPQITRPWATE